MRDRGCIITRQTDNNNHSSTVFPCPFFSFLLSLQPLPTPTLLFLFHILVAASTYALNCANQKYSTNTLCRPTHKEYLYQNRDKHAMLSSLGNVLGRRTELDESNDSLETAGVTSEVQAYEPPLKGNIKTSWIGRDFPPKMPAMLTLFTNALLFKYLFLNFSIYFHLSLLNQIGNQELFHGNPGARHRIGPAIFGRLQDGPD